MSWALLGESAGKAHPGCVRWSGKAALSAKPGLEAYLELRMQLSLVFSRFLLSRKISFLARIGSLMLSISIHNMKVVLSGSTGLIGGEVLTQCLNHPSITSVLVLTRRDPGELAGNRKAKVIIVKDFTSYEELTTNELKTADAAIWCMGPFRYWR